MEPGALERVDLCELCGGTAHSPRGRYVDKILGGAEQWEIVACDGCGVHSLNPRPDREGIGAHYPRMAAYGPHTTKRVRARGWQRRVGVSKRTGLLGWLKRELLRVRQDFAWFETPDWVPGGRILDIGCATGRFLDVMKEIGWSTSGVEVSDAAAEVARSRGHEVKTGSAEVMHFPEQSFDVVYLWHTLEHAHSPKTVLDVCRQQLKPGGTMYLAVPNLGSFQAWLWGRCWESLETPRHLYHFTRSTLVRYAEQAGFQDIRVRTRTGASVPGRSVRYAVNSLLGTRWARDPAWLRNLCEIPLFLSNVLRFLGHGSELRLCCRR